jgi:beta-glucosidase
VKNAGERAGDDVVQLYVRFPESGVSRPRKALRGFQRVSLEPGASQSVHFTLAAEDLAYWSVAGQGWVLEPGPVEILVGRSSADEDLALRARIDVEASAAELLR